MDKSNAYHTNSVSNLVYVFGETMAEQRTGAFENQYKFNGKELDEETGFYYYGARYYNPQISVWLSVDPLAVYNPVFEIEHYIDGQHNGGVFNTKNLNVYGYTYQSPIMYIDPNGKQVEWNKVWKSFKTTSSDFIDETTKQKELINRIHEGDKSAVKELTNNTKKDVEAYKYIYIITGVKR